MKSQIILNAQAERDILKKIYAANKLNDNIRKSYRILVRKTDSVIKEECVNFCVKVYKLMIQDPPGAW